MHTTNTRTNMTTIAMTTTAIKYDIETTPRNLRRFESLSSGQGFGFSVGSGTIVEGGMPLLLWFVMSEGDKQEYIPLSKL